MKSPIVVLPSLLLFGFAYLLSSQATQPTADTNANCKQEIHGIRQELRKLSDRVDMLQGQTHHVLPRGGLSAVAAAPRAVT